jgi:hypothetical protein
MGGEKNLDVIARDVVPKQSQKTIKSHQKGGRKK